MKKALSKSNIFKELSSRENLNVIYEIVCDIFEKKSNFNLDRNIGKKTVYTFIHAKLKDNFTNLSPSLVKKGGGILEAITYLNKSIIQDVAILLSKQESYKKFIDNVNIKPDYNTNIIQKNENQILNSLAPRSSIKIEHSSGTNERAEEMKKERYSAPKIEIPDFSEHIEDEKLNLDYAMDVYQKKRDEPYNDDLNRASLEPEKIEMNISELQASLFGSGEGGVEEELPYQPRNHDAPDSGYEERERNLPTLSEYIDETIFKLNEDLKRLVIIRDYINELNL